MMLVDCHATFDETVLAGWPGTLKPVTSEHWCPIETKRRIDLRAACESGTELA
jgi:hypothetical protein